MTRSTVRWRSSPSQVWSKNDWSNPNNEYWLERDAALRTDFNIKSGFQTEDMPCIKYKSKMKEYYQKA